MSKSLNSLIKDANAKERELRDIYKEIYNHPSYTAPRDPRKSKLFKNIKLQDRNVICQMIAGCWGKWVNPNEAADADCYELANRFLTEKAARFGNLQVKFYDVASQFYKLKSRRLQVNTSQFPE